MADRNDVIVRICEVLDIKDPYESNRIKVRFPYIDVDKSDDELPWCSPFMPKLVSVTPKPKEAVLVIMENNQATFDNRFYIGPVISQPYFNNFDPFVTTAVSGLADAKMKMYQAPSRNPENKGVLPEENDVALIGRENTDLILKPNEVQLRCGAKDNPKSTNIESRLVGNVIDPAYIQMFYKKNGFTDKSKTNMEDRSFSSVVNIVGDRINLLSRTSRDNYDLYSKLLLDQDVNSTNKREDIIEQIVEKGHPVVFGDDLIEFLKELIYIFKTHTHPASMDPPVFDEATTNKLNTNLDDMLSKAVRIN